VAHFGAGSLPIIERVGTPEVCLVLPLKSAPFDMSRFQISLLATVMAFAGTADRAVAESRAPIETTIADLIAQPWKYHNKTIRVSGILRYVLAGRGSRMTLGPDRQRKNLVDIDSGEPGAIWLPRYRYNWANVELTAEFDGDCVIPHPGEAITVCADGGAHGFLIPKAVKVIGYAEPVIESRQTIELTEIDPASRPVAGITEFVRAVVDAVATRDVDALMALDEPRLDPVSPEEMAKYRAATEDLFFSSDLRIFNTRAPEPGRDYRLYHEVGYSYTQDDYLCFCKQASCVGKWPRAGEIFNANPTRPWVCYRVMQESARWYFE
jgi:hypothetical protein